jgi:diguanylate cyclase (GGDEF)-like protein
VRSRADDRATRRQRSATASRRASVGLGALLLIVCGVTITKTHELTVEVESRAHTVTVAYAFQDARYFALLEDAELTKYRLDRAPGALLAHNQASASLDTTLRAVSAIAPNVSEIAQTQTAHGRYKLLAAEEAQLIAAGQDVQAATLQAGQLSPLSGQITNSLQVLAESNRVRSDVQLRAVLRAATLLRFGTPIALALALLLLVGLLSVTRVHRRVLHRQAFHDALTGLPNRLLFSDRVSQAIASAARTDAEPVVMMLDLDRFKEVNDTLGHHQGDRLLVQVAARLAAGMRPIDTVARFGGDEFTILLIDGGGEAATHVATRILKSLEPAFCLDGVTVSIEASIGIATAPPGAPDATGAHGAEIVSELLRHADLALYEAKAQQCGYAHFTARSPSASPGRLALLGELRAALDDDQLVLYYQPQVAAYTGEFLGVEALVRWNHPTRGLLSPGEFLALAESTTLIQRLTTIVIDKALQFSRSWLDKGRRLPVAVNVSSHSLLDVNFPAAVAAQLAVAGLPPELLCLELTEGTIMLDPDKAMAILQELRSMGVRVSVDDFGTGYSSMAYLKILPVNELKVDQSFVAHMTTDHSDAVLVESAIALGHNLGLSVVAEGVEDRATLIALEKLGADVIQGYYIGRPMPGEMLLAWSIDQPWIVLGIDDPIAAELIGPLAAG